MPEYRALIQRQRSGEAGRPEAPIVWVCKHNHATEAERDDCLRRHLAMYLVLCEDGRWVGPATGAG